MPIAYSLIGKTVKGADAFLRPQAAIAWEHLTRVVREDMGVDLDSRIIQARGGAEESAGTHLDGAAVDVRVWNLTSTQRRRIVLLARECGFPASWDRPWSGNEHLHLAADIPNVWTYAAYQVAAVKDGYNGLGKGGRGGKDDGPKPSAWRNTTTGPAWAREWLTGTPSASAGNPAPSTQEDDMSAADVAELKSHIDTMVGALQRQGFDRAVMREQALEVWRVQIHRASGSKQIIQEVADQTAQLTRVEAENAAMRKVLATIGAGQGVNLTELEDMMVRVLRENPVEVKVTAEVA